MSAAATRAYRHGATPQSPVRTARRAPRPPAAMGRAERHLKKGKTMTTDPANRQRRSRSRSILRIGLVVSAVGALAAGSFAVTRHEASAATSCSKGYVALTFDDGPNTATTTKLLTALKNNGVRATLFNVGNKAAANPSLVKAEVNAGMWIGNHGYTHSYMTKMTTAQMRDELSKTQTAIKNAGGGTPTVFRPPYGDTNSTLQSTAASLGLKLLTWDVDSKDWNGASTAAIVSTVGKATNGQVILMHDQYATTLAAIPQIAAGLKSRGLCTGKISPSTGRAIAP